MIRISQLSVLIGVQNSYIVYIVMFCTAQNLDSIPMSILPNSRCCDKKENEEPYEMVLDINYVFPYEKNSSQNCTKETENIYRTIKYI